LFDIFILEVGKWGPFDPTSKQVEEEKYSNEKLDKIMKKAHESEMKDKQMKDLNELVGRYKENMNMKDKQHEQRVKDKIKQSAADYNDEPEEREEREGEKEGERENEQAGQTVQTSQVEHDAKVAKSAGVRFANLNRDREAIKERLRKKLAESKAKKEQDLTQQKQNIRDESIRMSQKSQNIENLKGNKEQIEVQLQKMKELYENKMKN